MNTGLNIINRKNPVKTSGGTPAELKKETDNFKLHLFSGAVVYINCLKKDRVYQPVK